VIQPYFEQKDQSYQIQILEISTFLSKIRRKIRSFLFEITESFDGVSQRRVKFPLALELLTFTEQVDENVSYDLITIKRYDDLLWSSDFAQIRVRFQNFIFCRVRAGPKKTCARSFLLAIILFIQHRDRPLFFSSLIGTKMLLTVKYKNQELWLG